MVQGEGSLEAPRGRRRGGPVSPIPCFQARTGVRGFRARLSAMIPHGSASRSLPGVPGADDGEPGAAPAKGKPRERRATGSLRRAFIGAALATSIPFLLLIAYLIWGQISREHSRVEREAFAQASLLSAQVEKHFGARIEALTGAASLLGAGGGESLGRRGPGTEAPAGVPGCRPRRPDRRARGGRGLGSGPRRGQASRGR